MGRRNGSNGSKANGNGKGGQPTKLDKKLQNSICEAIQAGNFIETAALANGITRRTFHNWLSWAEAGKPGPYLEFFHALKAAESEAERGMLIKMFAAPPREWCKYAWWLERRFPNRWGRKFQELHVSQEGGLEAVQAAQAAFQIAITESAMRESAERFTHLILTNGGQSEEPN